MSADELQQRAIERAYRIASMRMQTRIQQAIIAHACDLSLPLTREERDAMKEAAEVASQVERVKP